VKVQVPFDWIGVQVQLGEAENVGEKVIFISPVALVLPEIQVPSCLLTAVVPLLVNRADANTAPPVRLFLIVAAIVLLVVVIPKPAVY